MKPVTYKGIVAKRNERSSLCSRFVHHLQVSGRVLELLKLILMALIVGGDDGDESLTQLIVLLSLSTFYLGILRVFRPNITRWDLAFVMVDEITDVATFALAIVILRDNDSADDADFREGMGIALLCLKGISFFGEFVDNINQIFEVLAFLKAAALKMLKPTPKMYKVVLMAVRNDKAYLERKYLDRWMAKTINKGLKNRELAREEKRLRYILWGTVQTPRRPEIPEKGPKQEAIGNQEDIV